MGSVLGLYLKKKIGPYKVCIFVNMGPFGKVAALEFQTFLKRVLLPSSVLAPASAKPS